MGVRSFHRLATRNTVRLVLAPALVFIATSLDRGYQTDFWQHLARGRLIATEHVLVSADRFTYTVAGRPFVDNNWLTQLLYYGVHSVGGLDAVQVMNSAVLAATFALLVRLCRQTSGSTGVAAAAGVGAFLGLWQTFLIRPQSFSMLLFVITYGLLDASRLRPRLLLWIPPVLALWANVHGGFAVGLALILAAVLGATWEWLRTNLPLPPGGEGEGDGENVRGGAAKLRGMIHRVLPLTLTLSPKGERGPKLRPFFLFTCLVASAAATLLNPYGWNVYRYASNLSTVGVARGIEEWLPPSLGSLNGGMLAVSYVVLGILLWASKRRATPEEVCLLACFALPTCLSTRLTVWWFLAAAPVIARLAAGALQQRVDRGEPSSSPSAPSAQAVIGLVAITAVVVMSLPWLERFNPVMQSLRPLHRTEADLQRLADALPRDGAPAKVFTRLEWANYLTWSDPGRASVFAEGRVELYPEDTWRRYLAVTEGEPGWEQVLDGYGVDFLLLDETYHRRLVERVSNSGRWSRQARSGPAVLFARARSVAPEAPDAPASPPAPLPTGDVAGVDF